jgi:hypothetical protein
LNHRARLLKVDQGDADRWLLWTSQGDLNQGACTVVDSISNSTPNQRTLYDIDGDVVAAESLTVGAPAGNVALTHNPRNWLYSFAPVPNMPTFDITPTGLDLRGGHQRHRRRDKR